MIDPELTEAIKIVSLIVLIFAAILMGRDVCKYCTKNKENKDNG